MTQPICKKVHIRGSSGVESLHGLSLPQLRALHLYPLLLLSVLLWDRALLFKLVSLLSLPSWSRDFLFLGAHLCRLLSRCLLSQSLNLVLAKLWAGVTFLS